MSASVAQGRTFASLRKYRNYRLYLGGQVVSATGTWMQDTTLPWLVLQRTHSPSQVGLLVFCRYMPFFVFGFHSGVLADRVDSRLLLIWMGVAQLLVTSALAVSAFVIHDAVWPFFVLAALGGACTTFDSPSRQSLVYRLVGREELPNAVALNSGVQNAGRVVGPALGGVLIAAVGVGWCFAINAFTFAAFVLALLLIRTHELFAVDRGPSQRVVQAIREGLRFAWTSPTTRLVLMLIAMMSLAGFNFRVLLPILADTTLREGPEMFGVLCAAFGIGAVVGALVTASYGRPTWRGMLPGAIASNVALLVLAPVHEPVGAVVLLFVIGASFTSWTTTAQSILQLTTPDHLRGRVLSLFTFAWAGLGPLGALITGWLCAAGGTGLTLLFEGLGGLAAFGLAALWAPGLTFATPIGVPDRHGDTHTPVSARERGMAA